MNEYEGYNIVLFLFFFFLRISSFVVLKCESFVVKIGICCFIDFWSILELGFIFFVKIIVFIFLRVVMVIIFILFWIVIYILLFLICDIVKFKIFLMYIFLYCLFFIILFVNLKYLFKFKMFGIIYYFF